MKKPVAISVALALCPALFLSSCVYEYPTYGYGSGYYSGTASSAWVDASYDADGFPIYGYSYGRPVYGYTEAGVAIFTIAAITAACLVPHWHPAPWYHGHHHYPHGVHHCSVPKHFPHDHHPDRRPSGGINAPIHRNPGQVLHQKGKHHHDGPLFGNNKDKHQNNGPLFGNNKDKHQNNGPLFGNNKDKHQNNGPLFGNNNNAKQRNERLLLGNNDKHQNARPNAAVKNRMPAVQMPNAAAPAASRRAVDAAPKRNVSAAVPAMGRMPAAAPRVNVPAAPARMSAPSAAPRVSMPSGGGHGGHGGLHGHGGHRR